MDGTLLNEQGEVPLENQEALREAHAKGVIIAITTGRHYVNAATFGDLIGVQGPVIAANGAQVGVRENEKPIYTNRMSKEQLSRFYKVAEKYNLIIYFMTEWGVLTNFELPQDHHYRIHNAKMPPEGRLRFEVAEDLYEAFERFDGQIIKALCIADTEKARLADLRRNIEGMGGYEVVTSWHNNIEVMNEGVNKGEGVRRLAEYLDIPRSAIMCIGDSENDLSMIEYAGFGVAMGNALDIIKEVADYVTDTNVNAGVAKAIRRFVL